MIIKGIEVDYSYLCSLICDICCVCISVDYDNKTFTIVIKDKCSSETHVIWTDKEAKIDDGKINKFLNLCYSQEVRVSFIPNIPYTDSQLGSMAEAVSSMAADKLHEFELSLKRDVYDIALAQITLAAN